MPEPFSLQLNHNLRSLETSVTPEAWWGVSFIVNSFGSPQSPGVGRQTFECRCATLAGFCRFNFKYVGDQYTYTVASQCALRLASSFTHHTNGKGRIQRGLLTESARGTKGEFRAERSPMCTDVALQTGGNSAISTVDTRYQGNSSHRSARAAHRAVNQALKLDVLQHPLPQLRQLRHSLASSPATKECYTIVSHKHLVLGPMLYPGAE